MENDVSENNKLGMYKIGLNNDREAVISAHFMHEINNNLNLTIYSLRQFSLASFPTTQKLIFENLIPILLEASDKFTKERISASKARAKGNFKEFGLNSPKEVGLAETISEVMFDRQFLKGSKSNFSRLVLCQKIKKRVAKEKPIQMVIPALPYKSSSPLKSRGILPDFSEINFLLALFEVVKTIDFIYRELKPDLKEPAAMFTIVCDGKRFNKFLNEPVKIIENYQKNLHLWVKKLGISKFVKIIDYQHLISNYLPKNLLIEKKIINKKIRKSYASLMNPLLEPCNMIRTIRKAIKLDPDPEECNSQGRFVPLFKSLIYIINYKILKKYANLHKKNYIKLYTTLTRHIFDPYVQLTNDDFINISEFIFNPDINSPSQEKIFEYLRQSMLREAWNATIKYIAEIKSDRDLYQEPIATCLPDHIRWTIHAKPGQLAILTTTAFGDSVQPWHGSGVFKLSKNNKIKLYTLPVLSLEGIGAIPITVISEKNSPLKEFYSQNQPLFYVHPNIKFTNTEDLFNKIKNKLTRKRKF